MNFKKIVNVCQENLPQVSLAFGMEIKVIGTFIFKKGFNADSFCNLGRFRLILCSWINLNTLKGTIGVLCGMTWRGVFARAFAGQGEGVLGFF